MNILVDTNIFLDVLLSRSNFLKDSQHVLEWCEQHPGSGWIAWYTLSNLSFLGNKLVGRKKTELALDHVLTCFDVAPVHSDSAREALQYGFADFEDALQAASAVSAKASYIVTRNVTDFRKSPVKAVTAKRFIAGL